MLRKMSVFLLFILPLFFFQKLAFALSLTSPAFVNGGWIPGVYTCDGKDISPALQWSEVPAGTKSFVLIMSDVDAPAGIWDHWILYNIPAQALALKENYAVPTNIFTGKNSWGRKMYNGPCPPRGVHRYFFRLYALDDILALSPGLSKLSVEATMKGHILATGELMGKYQHNN